MTKLHETRPDDRSVDLTGAPVGLVAVESGECYDFPDPEVRGRRQFGRASSSCHPAHGHALHVGSWLQRHQPLQMIQPGR
jgi:hypothetical protein